jgi:peptidoglycan/xylan/chitin deacetylase (PgdA/CDA1 family)
LNQPIPILMYHQVSPKTEPGFQKYTVTPAAFAKQMALLDVAGYVPINLDTMLDYRVGKTRLCGRPVVITFDDGYQDCIDYAVRILKKHRFTAVFYLVAGLMGQPSAWLKPEFGYELALIDWNDARQLDDAGYQIGSHSQSHPHLSALSTEGCHAELAESRQVLEKYLGHAVRHLAYPYGSFDERVSTIASQVGYQSACSVEVGFSTRHDSPLALRRVPVTGYDSLADFAWRLWSAYPLSEWMGSNFKAAYSFRWLIRLKQGK